MTNNNSNKLTVSIMYANMFGIIVMIAVFAIVAWLWYAFYGYPTAHDIGSLFLNAQGTFNTLLPFLVMATLVGGVLAHEAIHGIVFAHYAKGGWKSIHIGVKWEAMTPYCHCKEPLKARHYIVGALAPMVILGLIPMALGFALRDIMVTFWGFLFTIAAAGDILVAWLLRHTPSDTMVIDHPSEVGCTIVDESISHY